MIRRVGFVGICVADQERARAFYTQALGLEIRTDVPFPAMARGDGAPAAEPPPGRRRWIELGVPGADTGVVLFTPEGQDHLVGSFLNASLQVDDIEATCATLRERGVTIVDGPARQGWGAYALIKDSEGNTLCLAQPDGRA